MIHSVSLDDYKSCHSTNITILLWIEITPKTSHVGPDERVQSCWRSKRDALTQRLKAKPKRLLAGISKGLVSLCACVV